MVQAISSLKRLLLVLFVLFIPELSFAYNLADADSKTIKNENIEAIQKISKGVATIAQEANKAIVFVSIAKTVKGMPFGVVDPFEFFFNPQLRQMPRQREMPKQRGVGSGFIVDLEKGYILTNNHVVEDADEIHLKLGNGSHYDGTVVGRDPNTDIAVVQIKDKKFNRNNLSYLSLGDSDKVTVGDFVVALGAPYELEASLSFGIVSAIGREDLNITKLGSFIQTDAAINPGNSGGPLINMQGQAIGINTAIYSRTGASAGIGFSVPSNLARKVAEQLINHGKMERGFLGVQAQELDEELRQSVDLPSEEEGVLVANVVEESPADKAGLKPGDIITEINGKKISNSAKLVSTVGLVKPGSAINMTYYRDGKKRSASVKIGSLNEKEIAGDQNPGGGREMNPDDSKSSAFGLKVSPLTPNLKKRYNIEAPKGLLITDVEQDSPAARAGLQEGDLLITVNGKEITSAKDLEKATKSASRVLLRIERGGANYFISLRK